MSEQTDYFEKADTSLRYCQSQTDALVGIGYALLALVERLDRVIEKRETAMGHNYYVFKAETREAL